MLNHPVLHQAATTKYFRSLTPNIACNGRQKVFAIGRHAICQGRGSDRMGEIRAPFDMK
jgi:hypothetical protein